MSNSLVPYSSADGISLPATIASAREMMSYNHALKQTDADKITKAIDMGLFDMAAEYLWSRTINILKNDIMQFGDEFVSEMLDRPTGDMDSISEYDIITLSADLGIINKTARMEFLQFSETIQHYMSNDDPTEEYPVTKLFDMMRSCIKHVLGYEKMEYEVSFVSFRDQLKVEIVNHDHPLFEQIKSSPYFYKKTISKTLLSLSKSLPDSAERENVLANISYVIPEIWQDLSSDDRWAIGRSYAQANNEGDINLSKALRSVLIRIKGFDYVPENLRSNSYKKAAQDLLDVHFGMNNFYNEPAYAKVLRDMGTSIPAPAFDRCMTAVLACKIGNSYGISWAAQEYLDTILGRVSTDRWLFYLEKQFPKDEIILYKLNSSQDILERFQEVVKTYKLGDLSFTNPTVEKCIQSFNSNNIKTAKNYCAELYSKISP